MGQKKGQSSGLKQKEHQEASKEGKKKWKGGKDERIASTAHQCKDPSNHWNCYNINGHIKEHPKLKSKNLKEDEKKKNRIATNSSNQVESNSNMDDKIVCSLFQKEVNMRGDQALPH